MMEALGRVRLIVVHPGLAHMDEIMACAIAYACGVGHGTQIERRAPTAEELEDPSVLVLDVGLRHEPEKLNFDHHQRGRGDQPKCAYKLLAEWAGIDEELRGLFRWYDTWNLIDVCGPIATARSLGFPAGAMDGLLDNPLADWAIRRFADNPDLRRNMTVSLGKAIDLARRCWQSMAPKVEMVEMLGLKVADMRGCLSEEISRCSEAWFRQHETDCVLMNDSRSGGLAFLRRNDDPRLDFAKCAGRDYCLFAHPGGFILKTKDKSADPQVVLRDAFVD